MKIRFIGDVHGKFDRYQPIIDEAPCSSIQVGDFGIGFKNELQVPDVPGHYFIRGNHDKLAECKNYAGWLADGFFNSTIGLYVLGGAMSVDRGHRIEGEDWWPDEELSISELYDQVDRVLELKPEIMVTHACPEDVQLAFWPGHIKQRYPSRTAQALQVIFENHKPKYWVFGHYHQTKIHNLKGTEFICLGELEYLDMDI